MVVKCVHEEMNDDMNSAKHGYIDEKKALLRRLRLIEGQARGIYKMLEEEKYCIDILTQVSSMKCALEAVAMLLLEDHIKHCVVRAAKQDGPESDKKVAEAISAIRRMVKI